jgi:hypothetical protein
MGASPVKSATPGRLSITSDFFGPEISDTAKKDLHPRLLRFTSISTYFNGTLRPESGMALGAF